PERPAAPDLVPLSFEDLDPLDAPSRRPPKPGEALERFSHIVDSSPVFAESETKDLPEIAPINDPQAGLSVEIEARYEMRSAPAAAEPVVHLLLSLTPSGPPLLDPAGGPVAHVIRRSTCRPA